ARSSVSSGWRSRRSAAVSSRGRSFRLAAGPSGVNNSVSTPHGTLRLEDRSGVDVLDPDSGVEFGMVGLAGVVLLRVYGHLVTVAGELAGELAQADVIVVRT